MSKDFLLLKNVYKRYSDDIIPINNISISFKMSKFYVIKGASGAGKSTFLHVLGLLEKVDEGEIIWCEKDITKLNGDKVSEYRKKKIGFMPQSGLLIPEFTALENVMIPILLNKDIKEAEKSACDLLDKVGVYDRRNHFIKQLSGGEQQRVAIARAMANNPECIIADEPTGNLDEDNERKIFELFKQYTLSGKCVICVSHSDKAEEYADEVLHYKKGEIIL